jgi:beta-lactamase regulating signal transducer with metallopeptidase domain/uncharacterized membrane protein YkoI
MKMMGSILSLLAITAVMSLIVLIALLLNLAAGKVISAQARYIVLVILMVGMLIPFRPVFGDGLFTLSLPASAYDGGNLNAFSDGETSAIGEGVTDQASAGWTGAGGGDAPLSLPVIILIVWCAVALAVFLYHIFQYIRFTRMIKRWGKVPEDALVTETFRTSLSDAGLAGRAIDLRICGFVSSSMLTGFFHPVVLIPDAPLDEDELKFIFAHELTHYKRKDLIVKLLAVAVKSVNWFNPLAYWLCAAVQTEGETCCDEAVLKGADLENRRYYSEVIISMIGEKMAARTAFTTCFYAGKSNMKRRLDFIMDNGKKIKGFAIIGVACVLALTLTAGSVLVISQARGITSEASPLQIPASVSQDTPRMPSAGDAADDQTSAGGQTTDLPAITKEKAQETALAHAGGGTVVSCLEDMDDGRHVYDIIIVNGDRNYELEVDMLTGHIFEHDEDLIEGGHHNAGGALNNTAGAGTAITAEQAKRIGLNRTGGGAVVECDLDTDDGRNVYEITIIKNGKEYDMDIDANSGKILAYDAEHLDR